MITDPHFLENASKSVIRSCPKKATDSDKKATNPHKNQKYQIEGKLLLVLKMGKATQFIYNNYIITISKTEILGIKETQYKNKSNTQIITEQLQSFKDSKLNFGSDIEILAYNPTEYTKEKLTSQLI